MDFKAKPKDKGASEECLDLHSLKMLTIYDMNSGSLDGRKKKEIKICLETNENSTTQNLWGVLKTVLRGS